MASFIQVLGNQTFLVPPQLLIAHNNYRLLVNAGENTQRFCLEHKVKLSRISDILLTQITPSTTSGLPGLLLTLETGDSVGSIDKAFSNDEEGQFKFLPKLSQQWKEFKGPLEASGRSFRRVLLGTSSKPCNGELRKIRLWGPPPLFDFFRHVVEDFAPLRHLDVDVHQLLPSKDCLPSISLPITELECKQDSNALAVRLWCPLIENDIKPPYKKQRLSFDKSNNETENIIRNTMLIFGQFPKTAGKMDSKKIDELKIPRGPWLSKLKNGESITLEDGRIIYPLEVCDKTVDGERFAVVELPTEEIIPYLECDSLSQIESKNYSVIFDLSHNAIRRSMVYERFITSFAAPTTPILSCFCNELIPIAQPFVSSTCLQSVLRSFIPSFFPLGLLDKYNRDTPNTPDHSPTSKLNIYKAQLLDRWMFSPSNEKRGLDGTLTLTERCPVYDDERMRRLDIIKDQVEHCREVFSKIPTNSSLTTSSASSDRVFITFLGTGSAMPSKYRNVSGILLRIKGRVDLSILFDCGEGSISQLLRFSSSTEDFHQILKSLQVVFISHRHADHHLGLPLLLEQRHKKFPELPAPLVLAPAVLAPWLQRWNETVTYSPYRFIPCQDNLSVHLTNNQESVSLRIVEVDHIYEHNSDGKQCPVGCYGIRIDGLKKVIRIPKETITTNGDEPRSIGMKKNEIDVIPERMSWQVSISTPEQSNPLIGDSVDIESGYNEKQTPVSNWSVVYSGDTRPCSNLIKLANNCDVLIHEGTFEDSYESEAIRKRHSTLGEALAVAAKANVRYLLITHFSQRYPAIPLHSSNNSMIDQSCVVFDSFSLPIDVLFERSNNNHEGSGTRLCGQILSEGMRLLKPILTVLREE